MLNKKKLETINKIKKTSKDQCLLIIHNYSKLTSLSELRGHWGINTNIFISHRDRVGETGVQGIYHYCKNKF